MSYSQRLPATRYPWPQQTLTGPNLTFYIVGPKGKQGSLYDYGMFNVQTAFAGATLPQMEVGISGTLAAYGGLFTFSALTVLNGMQSVRSTWLPVIPDKKNFDLFILPGIRIAATTISAPVYVTVINAAGAGAAGAAMPFVDIMWDD